MLDSKTLTDIGFALLAGTKTYERCELGLPEIDRALGGGARLRTMTLVLAQSSAGKTTFGSMTALHTATDALGSEAVVFVLEDEDAAHLQLNEMTAGCQLAPAPRKGSSEEVSASLALGRLADGRRLHTTEERIYTAHGVIEETRRLKRHHPRLVKVVVDYLGEVHVPGVFNLSDRITEATDILYRGFRELNVSGVVLSQVSADGEKRLEVKGGKLHPEDAAGGTYPNRRAAQTLGITRDRNNKDPRKKNTAKIEMLKDRDGRSGVAVECHRFFNATTRRWEVCGEDGYPTVDVEVPAEPAGIMDPDSIEADVDAIFPRRM